MTLPTPSTAGALVALSSAVKSAITGGTAGKYLINDAHALRLRNSTGFHAALGELVDGLLERIVLPFQTDYTMPSISSLPTVNFGEFDDGKTQNLFGSGLAENLALSAKRSRICESKRFAPWEFWLALLTTAWRISRTSASPVECNVSSSSQRTIGVLPPSPPPGAFNYQDIQAFAQWVPVDMYRDALVYYSGYYKASLCLCEFDEDYRAAYKSRQSAVHTLLYSLLSSASGVTCEGGLVASSGPYFIYGFAQDNWASMVGRTAPKWLTDETERWNLVTKWKGSSAPLISHRPNLDVLAFYQMYLSLAWANWAAIPVTITHTHKTQWMSQTYTVDFDGGVTLTSETSGTETSTLPYAHWSRSVTSTSTGEWHNSGISHGNISIPVTDELLEELAEDARVVEAACEEEIAAIAEKKDAKERADATLEQQLNTFRLHCADELQSRWDNERWRGDSAKVEWSLSGRRSGRITASVPSSNPDFSNIADSLASGIWNLVGQIASNREIEISESDSMTFDTVTMPGDWTLPNSTSLLANTFALDAIKARRAYEDAVAAFKGYSKDVTTIILGHVNEGTVNYTDNPPIDPASVTEPVTITVTTAVTNPETDESYTTVMFNGTSTTPWPASALITSGYVASEAVALASSYKDELKNYYVHEGTYKPSRTPTQYRPAMIDIAKSSGEVSSITPHDLALTLAARAPTNVKNLNIMHVGGKPDVPLTMLPIITPTGHAGHASDTHATDYESIVNKPLTAWYKPDPDDSTEPEEGEKILPYAITDYYDRSIWKAGDRFITIEFSYSDNARSQSATAQTCEEAMTLRHSDSIALRVAWNWKSMPVNI